MLTPEQKDKILSDIYYDPSTGLSSAAKLHYRVKGQGITLKYVKEWIAKQELNQVFGKKEKIYNAIIGSNHDYQIDLTFYNKFKKLNRGYDTIMCVINITSRFAYAEPMKGKTQAEVNRAFDIIYKKIKKIDNITSDNEASFKNVIKSHPEITHWLVEPEDKNKVGIVERFNRTIRDMITKYLKLHKTKTWVDVLPQLMENYNSNIHSTIKIAPVDFTPADGDDIRLEAMKRGADAMIETNDFMIGDQVRALRKKQTFDKGTEKWSSTIYTIHDTDKLSFFLQNGRSKQVLKNRFKNWQLKKVDNIEHNPNVQQKKNPEHSTKLINKKAKIVRSNIKTGLDVDTEGNIVIKDKMLPKNNTRRPKQLPVKTNVKTVKPNLFVGLRVGIFWEGEKKAFEGTITEIKKGGWYTVRYDDDETHNERYNSKTWTILH